MRIITLIILSLLFVNLTFSQKEVASQDEIKQFFKTKTLVVVDDNPLSEYNFEIEDAVKKNWKLTEFEIIDLKQFEEKRQDPNFSFITIDKVYFEKDKTQAEYEFLCLSLGGKYKNITDMPQICAIPLCYFGVDEESYVYKIATLINFMQNHVELTRDHPELNSNNIITHYNKNIGDVKNKTLYLIKDEMEEEVNTEAKVKSVYPYKFQFVTREEIKEAIDNDDENVVFLHKVGPEGTKSKARCFKVLIGANDAKLYYFNFHMINDSNFDGFQLRDFKKLVNQ